MSSESTNLMKMPTLVGASDDASRRGQRLYVGLFFGQLLCTVAVPAILAYPFTDDLAKRAQAGCAASAFVVGVVIAATLRQRSFERIWYQGRAAAESMKSMAWKYAMRAEPYAGLDASEVYRRDMAKQVGAGKLVAFSGSAMTDEVITPEMSALRQRALTDRMDVYLRERIQDQVSWYVKRGRQWKGFETALFFAVLALQMLGAAYMIARAVVPTLPSALASVLSAGASALLAWGAMRHCGEIAEAYGQAVVDLALARARASAVGDEPGFAAFVSDAENAISREHTTWLARREVR